MQIVFLKAHVSGYTRADGTVVAAHEDKRAKHSPEQMAKWAAEKKARESAQATKRVQDGESEKKINQRRADGVVSTVAGKDFEPGEVEAIRGYFLSGDKHGAMAEGRNATVAAIERRLRSAGAEIDHVSESMGGKSKSLYVKVGDEIVRVSDHELPQTPERSANRDAGRAGRWSREVIVSDWQSTSIADYIAEINGRVVAKAHPATQAMSAARAPADLREAGLYRNPGEPGAAEAEAGEYSKPRIKWQGLTIAVENPAGSVRRGRNRHGATWEVRMRFDYGEILGTMGVDGDPVDVIVGPNLDAPTVYVVHQRRVNDWTEFDEDKCCVGFDSQADAEQAFLSNYNDPRFLGPVTPMPVAEFVTKVRATRDAPAMIKAVLFFKSYVGPYLRGGRMVQGYHGRTARAVATPGQLSLFSSNKPLGPSPFKGKDPVASTPDLFEAGPRVHEWSDRETAPVGAWVKADFKLADSQPVYQVRDLPLDGLYLPELDSGGRLQPEKRKYLDGYTERAKAGERAPSITVIEMENGKMRVVDGHRRSLAARAAGKSTIRALVSPLIQTPDGKKEATAELLMEQGHRQAS